MLFALGGFLALSLLLPGAAGQKPALTGSVRGFLLDWFGWGAYLLPAVPILYGAFFSWAALRRGSGGHCWARC
ncbi:hypothetical protein ACFP81_00540 [Deinococcus lacus]|uniref:Uncharacterized protein n=1 Tax=Deinococcus lacus TaxID=392561 RepID=A0ABW1YBC7_9DEIO